LLIYQWLDKLAAMCSDFMARKMIPTGHAASRQITHLFKRSQQVFDYEVEDNEPVDAEDQDILGHVILACTHGALFNPTNKMISD
jgi:hypothetical protein